jgi:hypothetical protein
MKHFTCVVITAIDSGDLHREHKSHRLLTRSRHLPARVPFGIGPQASKPASAGTRVPFSSSRHAGWMKSPVPSTLMPSRSARPLGEGCRSRGGKRVKTPSGCEVSVGALPFFLPLSAWTAGGGRSDPAARCPFIRRNLTPTAVPPPRTSGRRDRRVVARRSRACPCGTPEIIGLSAVNWEEDAGEPWFAVVRKRSRRPARGLGRGQPRGRQQR